VGFFFPASSRHMWSQYLNQATTSSLHTVHLIIHYQPSFHYV